MFAAVAICTVPAAATPHAKPPEEKVPICHRTNSVQNPYHLEEVNGDSIVRPDGTTTSHGDHTGPVYPGEDWGDIIPPFSYTNSSGGTSTYPGSNWTSDGQAIFEAGCEVILVEPPEETTTTGPATTSTEPATTTTTEPATTTTEPATTTTTEPGTTTTEPATTTTEPATTTTEPATTTTEPATTTTEQATTTTIEGSTTTTTLPAIPTTPTTAPPSEKPPDVVTPSDAEQPLPAVDAEAIDPGDNVVDLGALDDSEKVTLEQELQDELAYTGFDLLRLAGFGALAVGIGAALVLGTRSNRRSRPRGRTG
jgi:hypothetical protein